MISWYFSFCIRNPTYNYEVTLFLKWSDPTCLFIFFPVCCLRRCLQIEGHQPLKKNDDRKKGFDAWDMNHVHRKETEQSRQ